MLPGVETIGIYLEEVLKYRGMVDFTEQPDMDCNAEKNTKQGTSFGSSALLICGRETETT